MSRRLANLEDLAGFLKNTRMDHSPEPKDIVSQFVKLLVALASNRVDFSVIGGLAVIFNGYPHLTLDMDMLVSNVPDNLRKSLDGLDGWGKRLGS